MLTHQNCYLRLDGITSQYDSKYMNGTFLVNNSPDNESGLINIDVVFFPEFYRQQLEIEIRVANSANDDRYLITFVKTKVNLCKLYDGLEKLSGFLKGLFQSYFDNLNMRLSCPLPHNVTIKLTNATYNDSFFPPMPYESRYLLNIESYGMIKNKKGWIKMFNYAIKFRVRKFQFAQNHKIQN